MAALCRWPVGAGVRSAESWAESAGESAMATGGEFSTSAYVRTRRQDARSRPVRFESVTSDIFPERANWFSRTGHWPFFSFAGNFSSLAEEADAGWDGAEANMAKAALMNGHLVFWVSGQSGQAGLHLRIWGDLIKITREFSFFGFNK